VIGRGTDIVAWTTLIEKGTQPGPFFAFRLWLL